MRDYLQVFLQAVNGKITSPSNTNKLKLKDSVTCQCECGRVFRRKLGDILVRGRWCKHTGPHGDCDDSYLDIPLRMIYAFSSYIVTGRSEVRDIYYHITNPNVTVVYLKPDDEEGPREDTRERSYINVPFKLIKEEGVDALKEFLIDYFAHKNIRFVPGFNVDMFRSSYSQFNFEIARLVWDYTPPSSQTEPYNTPAPPSAPAVSSTSYSDNTRSSIDTREQLAVQSMEQYTTPHSGQVSKHVTFASPAATPTNSPVTSPPKTPRRHQLPKWYQESAKSAPGDTPSSSLSLPVDNEITLITSSPQDDAYYVQEDPNIGQQLLTLSMDDNPLDAILADDPYDHENMGM